MANRQVSDTLAVATVSAGVVALALLVTAVLTGAHWLVAVVAVVATLVFAVRWSQERRRIEAGQEPFRLF